MESLAVIDFNKSVSKVEVLTQALMASKIWSGYSGYSSVFPRQMVGLHLAVYFGIQEAARHLVSSNNAASMSHQTSSWASGVHRLQVVRAMVLRPEGLTTERERAQIGRSWGEHGETSTKS